MMTTNEQKRTYFTVYAQGHHIPKRARKPRFYCVKAGELALDDERAKNPENSEELKNWARSAVASLGTVKDCFITINETEEYDGFISTRLSIFGSKIRVF